MNSSACGAKTTRCRHSQHTHTHTRTHTHTHTYTHTALAEQAGLHAVSFHDKDAWKKGALGREPQATVGFS